MSIAFRCRCGQRVFASTGEVVECPACGRDVIVVSHRNDNSKLWLIAAIALTVLALAGLGGLIAYIKRERPREEVVRAVEPPSRKPMPTDAPPKPNRVPTLPDEWIVVDPIPEGATIPPPPREVIRPFRAVPSSPPARVGYLDAVPIEPPGRYKVGSTFGQEIVVSRRSAFRVAGMDYTQGSQYAFAASLVVTKVNADGSLVVSQTIVNVKLIDADQDLRASLAAALEKAKGTQFELTIDATGKVTGLTGLKDPIQVRGGKNAAIGESLRIWSLLDADAWKEMAALTFFQPEKVKANETWNRAAAHDWGPLGTWQGKTIYARGKPTKPGTERFDYRHDIYYKPPAAGADANLPIRIVKADFKTVAANGSILYDPASKRVTATEETFGVRGAILVSLGGIEAGIEMEELQSFKLTVTEQVPQELVGPRLKK